MPGEKARNLSGGDASKGCLRNHRQKTIKRGSAGVFGDMFYLRVAHVRSAGGDAQLAERSKIGQSLGDVQKKVNNAGFGWKTTYRT